MSHRSTLRKSRLALSLAFALATAPAFAQQTSSAMGGLIIGADGNPIAGASVLITHTPSGTISRAATDENGRYNARGLRVGGPYTVLVIADGFQSKSSENVYLQLAQTGKLSMFLEPAAAEMEAIEVIAAVQSNIFSPDKMGAGTTIGAETLQALPSIKSDLQDYARLDPRISQTDKERGEISALGQNSRFNLITIDRVSTNDTFGLESNNLPTIRQPISMEAIQEVQINIANYDVAQRGYTGANINAVTKSGTNEFSGSVYGTYREKEWVRERDDRGVVFNRFETDERYGATFGGPLVKDTLFFFLNYEKTTIGAPGPDLASGPFNRATNGISAAQVAEVQAIARGYGLEPGDLSPSGLDTEVESALARFDWNINDYHRAAFRVSKTEQSEVILPGFGANFFSLSSHWYSQTKEFENYVVELFSDWSDTFSTEASISYRDYFSTPINNTRAPQIQVDFGIPNFRFGTEQFRHQNVLETKTLNAFVAGNLFVGDHDIKFGADYESNEVFNLFLESNLGRYRFSSIDNFRRGVYREFIYRAAASGDPNDAAAEFTLDNIGVFAQDIWSVNSNLSLTMGLRLDIPQIDDRPQFNQRFTTAFGQRNDGTIDGNDLIQPRFGFNYTFDSERPTQVRGGVGLFQGSAMSVWLANPFTNNGLTIRVFGCGTGGLPNCPANSPAFSPNPDNQPEFAVGAQPAADVDLVSRDLEQPAVWKANLAFDHELPWWGVVAGAEVIFTTVDTAIAYEHLNLGQPSRTGRDGRDLYWRSTAPNLYNPANGTYSSSSNARNGRNPAFNDVLLARPTSKGDGENFTLSLTKPMGEDSDWFWQIAYSYSDATEVNGLTSSRAISNWASRAIVNPNEERASRSAYVTRDRFTGAISYRKFFFSEYKTEIAMFYEGRKGKPYSWTFQNDANGDGFAGNDLMYIPSGPGDVLFFDPTEEARFWEIVNDTGLSAYAGRTLPRNSSFSSWVNNFDMRITQDLPGFFGEHKSQIWFDILNVGNLINKDWGHIDEVLFQGGGGQARSFVNFAGIDQASGRYIYDVVNVEQLGRRDNNGESRWAVQIGFRYQF